MAILWSAKEKGFFDTRIPYPDLPEDCIEIGEEARDDLMRAQAEGWEIIVGSNGKPDVRKRE